MNIAYWLRVSTDEQDTANQRPALDAMRTQRGDPEPVVVFDLAASPGPPGARSARLCVGAGPRVARGHGAGPGGRPRAAVGRLRAGEQPGAWLEVENDERDLLIAVTGWTAWMEARRLSERTKAGIARAQERHGMVGKRGPDKRPRKGRARL